MSNDKSSYLDWFVRDNTNNTSGAFKIEKQAEEKWSRDTVLSLQTPIKLLSVREMNSPLTKLINGASAVKCVNMLYSINHESPTYLTFWKEALLLISQPQITNSLLILHAIICSIMVSYNGFDKAVLFTINIFRC